MPTWWMLFVNVVFVLHTYILISMYWISDGAVATESATVVTEWNSRWHAVGAKSNAVCAEWNVLGTESNAVVSEWNAAGSK